jgi:hypothetical protein
MPVEEAQLLRPARGRRPCRLKTARANVSPSANRVSTLTAPSKAEGGLRRQRVALDRIAIQQQLVHWMLSQLRRVVAG